MGLSRCGRSSAAPLPSLIFLVGRGRIFFGPHPDGEDANCIAEMWLVHCGRSTAAPLPSLIFAWVGAEYFSARIRMAKMENVLSIWGWCVAVAAVLRYHRWNSRGW